MMLCIVCGVKILPFTPPFGVYHCVKDHWLCRDCFCKSCGKCQNCGRKTRLSCFHVRGPYVTAREPGRIHHEQIDANHASINAVTCGEFAQNEVATNTEDAIIPPDIAAKDSEEPMVGDCSVHRVGNILLETEEILETSKSMSRSQIYLEQMNAPSTSQEQLKLVTNTITLNDQCISTQTALPLAAECHDSNQLTAPLPVDEDDLLNLLKAPAEQMMSALTTNSGQQDNDLLSENLEVIQKAIRNFVTNDDDQIEVKFAQMTINVKAPNNSGRTMASQQRQITVKKIENDGTEEQKSLKSNWSSNSSDSNISESDELPDSNESERTLVGGPSTEPLMETQRTDMEPISEDTQPADEDTAETYLITAGLQQFHAFLEVSINSYEQLPHAIVDHVFGCRNVQCLRMKHFTTMSTLNATEDDPNKTDDPIKDDPIKDDPIKDDPIKEDESIKAEPVRDNTVRDNPIRDNPIRENPVRDNPIRENPIRDDSIKEESTRKKTVCFTEGMGGRNATSSVKMLKKNTFSFLPHSLTPATPVSYRAKNKKKRIAVMNIPKSTSKAMKNEGVPVKNVCNTNIDIHPGTETTIIHPIEHDNDKDFTTTEAVGNSQPNAGNHKRARSRIPIYIRKKNPHPHNGVQINVNQ